jgi:hypothetical protein
MPAHPVALLKQPGAHWDLEEDCGLCYVADTRARTQVTLPWVVEGAVVEMMVV